MPEAPRLYPTFRCHDPQAMIDWLVDLAGFSERAVHRDNSGAVAHAEMSLGPSILMLGPHKDDAYGRMVGDPGGRRTDALYVAVDDPDALHARMAAAGSPIEEAPTDRDYGSREFICRDPEGGLWTFGTYRPAV